MSYILYILSSIAFFYVFTLFIQSMLGFPVNHRFSIWFSIVFVSIFVAIFIFLRWYHSGQWLP
jgi:hypothetical protein